MTPNAMVPAVTLGFAAQPTLAAIAGEAGVRYAVGLLREEISCNMAMVRISSAAEMKCDLLVRARGRSSADGQDGESKTVDLERWIKEKLGLTVQL